MEKINTIYRRMSIDPTFVPVSFRYGKEKFFGFSEEFFSEQSKATERTEQYEHCKTVLRHGCLEAVVDLFFYEKYDALEYKVTFTNVGDKNSEVIGDLVTVWTAKTNRPTLKGILGDHVGHYVPYKKDLTVKKVMFRSPLGRSTHILFPYFHLEDGREGYRFAIGWSGTWNASFRYKNGKTTYKAGGCNGLKTYLKPNESVRTPLFCMLRYEGTEEEGANAWRKWFSECVLPKEYPGSLRPLQPLSTYCLALDTGRQNSDGSISEYAGSYRRSMDAYYGNGMTADYRWFDAGWYVDPEGRTVPTDWRGTVGTWELDTEKWPEDSFRDSVRLAREHGTKTLVWFEPERVTHLTALCKNYGYQKEWAIRPHWKYRPKKRDLERGLSNLGIPECLDWTTEKIISFLDKYEIDMYREDFNTDCGMIWAYADRREGRHRKGITENKYTVGHYELWDRIIAYCAAHGKCLFVDSCASGGGRNDLESAHRSVPLLRSDADRTTISLRLAMTSSLSGWLPFNGACAKESSDELENGNCDMYVMRSTYLPAINLVSAWYFDREILDYPALRRAMAEWKEVAPYLLKDFYLLTPYLRPHQNGGWTVYEYFDEEKQKGVVQAFRQEKCSASSVTVRLRGLKEGTRYLVRNADGGQETLSADVLSSEWRVTAREPRTALLFFIEQTE